MSFVLATVMLVALTAYALGAGADFGGGVWDLLATGPRAGEQRRLIEQAIGPIWEANHVWLILVVVLLFIGFPPAYAAASVALHVPLTLMLLGMVLRGSAFVFRHYSAGEKGDDARAQLRWGRVFAIASTITPIFLGVVMGAVTAGIRFTGGGVPEAGFFGAWLSAFPFAVGLFALALFAFLAAVYLTNECDGALREDFRARALVAGATVGLMALLCVLAVGARAPEFRRALTGSWWSWPLQIATGAVATLALASLWVRRFAAARILAAVQVALILAGWGAAQRPYLIAPAITIDSAAAPPGTLAALLWALAVGAVTLFPSLIWLYRVFKRRA
jgi:cytochrome d ubiquinol oxidase subunit II